MKETIKNLIPDFLINFYHFALAYAGALAYGFPSKRMTVIGVTGTKGKTTTSSLIYQILKASGVKTGLATTVNFSIGDGEWRNETKQTMLGRFKLQKLLSRMANNGCRYAVIETSSEGIAQHRQRFIDYKIGVFTNLSPEHIERHGGFENYRSAKVKLFEQIARRKDGIGIFNLDDQNAGYFLEPHIGRKLGFYADEKSRGKYREVEEFRISGVATSGKKSEFMLNEDKFGTPLLGEFNVYNAAAAAVTAFALRIPAETVRGALLSADKPAGRFEVVETAGGFRAVIDYAHEPKSLEAVYSAVKIFKPKKIICVLGAQGGGRDKWKRPAMGKVAAEYCDEVIVTNEDPYDEPPEKIIGDVVEGALQAKNAASVHKITDRRGAIAKAVSLAGKSDIIVLTGKGGETQMCVEGGKKIHWDDREVLGQEIEKSLK